MTRSFVGGLIALLLSLGTAEAAPITIFGENVGTGLGNDSLRGPTGIADTARGSFQTQVPLSNTQNLDLAVGPVPIGLSFGSIGATLSGGGSLSAIPGTTTDGFGGFPISNDNVWVLEGGSFSIKLGNKVKAFGFYGIDIGDAGGQLSLALNGVSFAPGIGHSVTTDDSRATSGSVFFFGLINDVPFDLITFSYSNINGPTGTVDRFNFDNFMAGPAIEENLAATPEPATLLLLGTSLAGMAGAAWNRRKAARSTD